MLYAIGELFFLLTIAAVLGFFLGWAVHARSHSDSKPVHAGVSASNPANKEIKKPALQTVTPNAMAEEKQHAQPVLHNDTHDTHRETPKTEPQDDDLKEIKGIGPKLEKRLKEMGITSFYQIAKFQSHDIEKLADTLGAFRGRIERDGWVIGATQAYQSKYGEALT